MKSFRPLAFALALMSVSMAAPGCAGKLPDIWPALKACGTNDVSWGAATEVFGDLVEIVGGNPAGETDLLALLASDVGGGIPCLVNYFESQGGSTGAAATKFKTAHAKELKAAAARGPSACNGLPKADRGGAARASGEPRDERALRAFDPGEGAHVSAVAAVSGDGRVPGDSASPGKLTLSDCAARAGTPNVIAPPSGCMAWRADRKNWRNSRWVRL